MNRIYCAGYWLVLTFLVSCFIVTPATLKAAAPVESDELTQLLNETKTEAVELLNDSAELEAFSRSQISWESHAGRIEMIKEHVNNAGKLLAKMKDVEVTGSTWQQAAIKRVEPLLRELATNTETVIAHLNENKH